MTRSQYVAHLRAAIGHDLLLTPGVTAVIRRGEKFLLSRHDDDGPWGFVGGAIEPGESPEQAIRREVCEELGTSIRVGRVVGVYGGESLEVTYPNGDRVGYVTTAFEVTLAGEPTPDGDEISEIGWFTREQIHTLSRERWIDPVFRDAAALHSIVDADVARVQKVVAYIVRDEQLVVLRHIDQPWQESGLQVPAGTVRPGESPLNAVLREAYEETGLAGLRVAEYLGVGEYDIRPYADAVHERHYFRLAVEGDGVTHRWETHEEGDGTGERIRFELSWLPLAQAHVLSGGQAAFIGRVTV